MKKVIEKIKNTACSRIRSVSGVTRKRTGVFIESITVKMEFEVTMGLYRKGACLIK